MSDEPNWQPEIRYPKIGDTLLKTDNLTIHRS